MFEMNCNQKVLFEELTPLQKEIALNSISGMNDIDAYKASKGKAKTVKAMEASVNQILGNLGVKAFIDSMANHIVNPAIMSRDEMMKELTLIARTNSNDLLDWGYRDVEAVNKETGETEIVQQSFWTLRTVDEIKPEHMSAIEEVSVGKDGLKFKRTSKLSAMKQLADLGGYEAPKKIETKSAILEIPADASPEDAAKIYNELMNS
jgi:phage terminase small subunit